MKCRQLARFASGTLLATLLLAMMMVFSAHGAAAQDATLPLKIRVGSKAPDFALPSGTGKTVRLSQFAGHNVLIDFYRGYW